MHNSSTQNTASNEFNAGVTLFLWLSMFLVVTYLDCRKRQNQKIQPDTDIEAQRAHKARVITFRPRTGSGEPLTVQELRHFERYYGIKKDHSTRETSASRPNVV